MNDAPILPSDPRDRTPQWATALLVCGGGVAVLTIVVGGIIAGGPAIANTSAGWQHHLELVSLLAIGFAVALMLAGMSIAMRVLLRLQASLSNLEGARRELSERAAAPPEQVLNRSGVVGDSLVPSTDSTEGPWQEMLDLLREIRENSLLSDDGRREKLARIREDVFAKAHAQIKYFIAQGDYTKARELAVQMAEQNPDDLRAQALASQVESARIQREASDVANVAQEVGDLISMSAWPQARAMAQQLQEQHPDSAEARQLMVRIEREFRLSQDEQQRRMYAEVQRFVTRKRWEEALVGARTFIERFAGSDDAEALRMQIPTLKLNAEIEIRQQLETQIMTLAKHGRYIEATALAKRVIEQFPESPQAEALRVQIARLEELATNPEAPPARVRIE